MTFSQHRDQTMRQVVTYKRVKTMENSKTIIQKSGCGCIQEVVVYGRF